MRRIRRELVAVTVVLGLLAVAGRDARADEVDDLVKLVSSKPPAMDEDEWREKRRDAAKKLGKLGDKRAVPALIRVVETETFDVVAEHAIDSLGRLGDDRAVPALQDVVADTSRDRYARDLARKALRKLGASASGGGSNKSDDDDDDGGVGNSGGGSGSSVGSSTNATVADGPSFDEDILAASEVLQLAVGGASLTYDSVREVAVLDGQVDARYWRQLEKPSAGYGYGGRASIAGGLIDLPGGGTASESLVFNGFGGGDARFYLGGGDLYGAVEGGLALSTTALKVERAGGGNTTRELVFGADINAGLGVGYGRVLDVGAGLRLRRIELALAQARVLGRPITPDLAARIMRAWWALRGEQGTHDRLVATVKILREAGVLLGEPDASTTYKLLEVLRDGQLDHRMQGLDVRLGVAESYLVRDPIVPVADGRVETLLLRARYGMQATSTVNEIVGEGFGRLRVLADDGEPAPWSVGAAAAWRRYAYSDYFDPIGALEVRAEVGLSDYDNGNAKGSRLGGGVGWIWSPSRASRYRLAANASLESGEFFLGATFEAVYGFLDVGYVGAAPYAALK